LESLWSTSYSISACRCRCLFSDLLLVASQSYAALEDSFRHLCISRWLLPLSYRGCMDYGNATLAGLPACLLNRLSSTLQLGRSPVFVARSILQMLSPVSTGFEHPGTSSSNLRSLSTELFTALHLRTYRANFSTSPIYRRDVEAGCARRPPVSSMSVCRDLLLSAIARLLLPAHDSGTVYLSTSSLPRHSQHFVRNWKHVYFGNHTQTLFFNCFAVVVLKVNFYLGHFK